MKAPNTPQPRWRSSRLRALIATMLIVLAAVLIAPTRASAAGTTYYVDSAAGSDDNAGTSTSAPWKTLDKVNATTFSPGTSVLFKGGSEWAGSLMVTSSGTTGSPITFSSYGTGQARIDGNTTATNTILVNNAHDVTISNLEVTNSVDLATSSSDIYRGIYVQEKDTGEVSGIVIQGNYVHAIDGVGNSGGIGNGGIVLGVRGNTTATYFSGAHITGNEVGNVNAYGISTFTTWCADCVIYSSETGIPSSELASTRVPSTGLVIDSNYVHDVTGGGITPQYADHALVEHNTVDRAASNQLVAGGGNVGIWWQGTKYITVQYNTVRHTAATGMYSNADGQAFDADMSSSHSTVQYNISDNNTGGFFFCLIDSYNNQIRYNLSVGDRRVVFRFEDGCGNSRAYNNTIWGTTEKTPTLTAPGVSGTPADMVGIIAVDAGTAAVAPSNTVADNIIYNPANAPFNISGQDVNDYSHNLYYNGTSSSPTASNDPSPTTGDPLLNNTSASLPTTGFVTPAQFTAYMTAFTPSSSSPVRNKGVSEFGQTKDALGTSVPVGGVDLGAIQHAVTATATTTLGTTAGNVSNLVDGDVDTSWASATGSTFPGNVTVSYSDARTIDAVTLAAKFGTEQGPTNVTIQTIDGSTWTTQDSNVALTWHTDSSTAEYLKVQLPAAVTTTGLRILINSSNDTNAYTAFNEIEASYQGMASTSFGEISDNNSSANLVDNDPATSWAASEPPLGYVEVDSPTVTATSITLSVAFGQGQGPTSVFVQALNGDNGEWQTVAPSTSLTWSSNTSAVESRTLTFSAPTTATRFEVQIKSANNTWGHVALNGITINS